MPGVFVLDVNCTATLSATSRSRTYMTDALDALDA